MPDRYRGVRDCAPLGARIDRARPQGPAGVAERRQGLLKRGKKDAADAEAICEATSMRFVPVESEEQHLLPLRSGLPPPTPLPVSRRTNWSARSDCGAEAPGVKRFLEMKLPVLLMRPCRGEK